jgi:hypothetical protein
MRHFTKTHNELKWLFPVADTEKEAEEIFESAEEQAKSLLSLAGVKKEDEDLAIDCFMKGYSNALQMETCQYVEKRIETIFKNIFDIEGGYYTECTEENRKKWLRFIRFETLLKRLAYRKDKQDENARKALAKMLENSGFDSDGPIEERLKIL